MKKEENDLRDRTKRFALQIIRMFTILPKAVETQVKFDFLIQIFLLLALSE